MLGVLESRVSVITGGSRGIGKAIARAFLSEGSARVLAARGAGALGGAGWDPLRTNLRGPSLAPRFVLPQMLRQGRGKIINLAGGGASSPFPRFSAYATSKAAVVRLTETLAEELKGSGIDVNAIAPGAVNTRLLDQVLEAGDAAGDQFLNCARRQREEGGTPPEKAAELAVFLASDKSNGLTGRLISAVWDEWPEMALRIPEIMASDLYTLRRVTQATP